MVRLHSVLFVAVALSACVDEVTEPELVEETPVSDDTTFHDISVTIRADGTVEVSEPRPITVGEQRAQNQMKSAVARGEAPPLTIAQDTGCSPFSLWLYDRTDLTGNRICFSGSGSTDLHTWPRNLPFVFRSNWALSKGSIYAGWSAGSLAGFGTSARPPCPSGRQVLIGQKVQTGGFGGGISLECSYMQPVCTGGSCVSQFGPFEIAPFDLTGPAFYLTQY